MLEVRVQIDPPYESARSLVYLHFLGTVGSTSVAVGLFFRDPLSDSPILSFEFFGLVSDLLKKTIKWRFDYLILLL